MIETATSIHQLDAIREALRAGTTVGAVTPSDKTLRRWEEAFWKRVVALMIESEREIPFIYSTVLTWAKPPRVEEALEMMLKYYDTLPNPTELLRQQGITIEGITSL